MGYRGLSILARDRHFKNPKIVFCHWRCVSVPIIKVADEVRFQGIRCPFSVDDVAVVLHVKAKRLEALAKVSCVALAFKAYVNLPW